MCKVTRVALCVSFLVALAPVPSPAQEGPMLIFAVVMEIPEDKNRVAAEVLAGGNVSSSTLLPTDQARQNVMWRKLEMCQCLKANAMKVADGYQILSFRMVGPSMLPMSMQGIAGDCMLKKAMDYAPLLD